MKVAVITRHAVFNYGSLLQAIATQKCIEDLGYESSIIDYVRTEEDYHNISTTLLHNNPNWNKNAVTRMIYRIIQTPKFLMMGKHFEKLRKGRINITCRYSSIDELRMNRPYADIYLTGSDQVWGPIGTEKYDPVYFLDFLSDDDVRVSYAASFGKTSFDEHLLKEFQRLLSKYAAISVREKSAVEIINNMNIQNVSQVLDPTLLLDSKYWDSFIEDSFPDEYILIYQLHNNPNMVKYAYDLSKKTGLKLVSMSSTIQHLAHKGSKHVFLPTLSQWLGYIKNAKFMITDSFHGTAFAINFNTQFVNVLPKGTATRNQSILELIGLEKRVVMDYNNFKHFESQIDYCRINEIIKEERIKSLNILRNILNCRAEVKSVTRSFF